MKIFTKEILARLTANGKATRAAQAAGKPEPDHKPVVKIFNPTGSATWLFTELDEDGDTLFGLADLGFACPELGDVSRRELEGIRVQFNLKLERDAWFTPDKTLSAYATEARRAGRIKA